MRNINMLPALCCAKRCDKFDLQRFGEGAAAAGTGETSGDGPAATQAGRPDTGQDAAAPEQADSHTTDKTQPAESAFSSEPDKTAEFEKLIRGEYKEQFAAKTQRILSQRFRENREQAAKAEADNRRETEQSGRAAEQICRAWARQSREAKAMYPKFDFGSEAKDPAFARLLKAGVSVRQAYEACHLQEVLGGAMQYTADRVAAAVAAGLADRAARPAENGTTSRAGAVMKRDVNQLTRTEREAIERRVARGEHIRF